MRIGNLFHSVFFSTTCLLLVGSWASTGAAVTTNLIAVADTSLFELRPANNLGGVPTLAAGTTASGGRTRALIKFDPSSVVPSGARVTAARLHLTVVRTPVGGGADSVFAVHRLLRDWGEGNKGSATSRLGAPATSQEATWVTRFHPATPWGQPGAQAGVDYLEPASATAAISGLGAYVFETSALADDVQTWLDDSSLNFGWLLRSEAEETSATARRFGAREDPSNAPRLEIEYETLALRIRSAVREGDQLVLRFDAQANQCYAVEFTDALPAKGWQTLTNLCADAQGGTLIASDSVQAGSVRFYRLRLDPGP